MSEHDQTTPPSDNGPSSDQPLNETVDSDGAGIGQEAETKTHEPAADAIGQQIGPYRILEELGEGGMGSVYLAEQREPVRRRVALKIIKAGMDTGQVIARFEAERQALAMMDHANIARVFEAGMTDSGRPYFVMELVDGKPITKFCDDHKLGIDQRLEIFRQVCSAVQHAHQKGIIHRDLKPSNVLVAMQDDQPVPKVIDFGLAKATGQQLTEKTMFTAQGQVLGTLEYMSPEQANLNDLDVDTRSDIYSLGVILYELLTGSTPLTRESLKRAAFVEILKRIKEEEPERPSSRIRHSSDSMQSISSVRQIEPRKLSSLMKGELDWVVMKAIEKDRSRRYESITELVADVSHYLANEPVAARPPSLGYRIRKSYQRRRSAYWMVATVFALLIATAIFFQVYSGIVKFENAQRNTKVTVDSLRSTRGIGVPLVLTDLDELPRELVLRELNDRFPNAIGQPKLSLAYGLAHMKQLEIEAIFVGLLNTKTKGEEYQNIATALSSNADQAIEKLISEAKNATTNMDWKTKTRLGVVAMHLGELSIAKEMLTATKPDPIQRTTFISEFPELSGVIQLLVKKLGDLDNPYFRSGICLSLGGIESPTLEAKDAWKSCLETWYLQAPDGGSHSAARWIMKQWKLELPPVEETRAPTHDRNWWHAPEGLRFVKIQAGIVDVDEGPVEIDREIWLSDCEITHGLLLKFKNDESYTGLKPDWNEDGLMQELEDLESINELSNLPALEVSWFDAVLICNWLSWRLSLEPCYEIENKKDDPDKKQQYEVKLLPTDGIRLPTDAEWEYSCRALTTTAFSFGDDVDYLSEYGWFERNSKIQPHHVAILRCNTWGLYDLHGNVSEWCWDIAGSEGFERVDRGGNFLMVSYGCSSAMRDWMDPSVRSRDLGFRVTCGPSSQASGAEGEGE